MSLFNRRKGVKARPASQQTLQEMHGEFNQLLFQLGDFTYRRSMIRAEEDRNFKECRAIEEKLNKLGEDAKVIRQRIQEEVAAKVEEGKDKAPKDSK